jgi:transcriptional regulator with XRE-family HTH domain
MGFKENLKAELAYKNILVKELATRSGISRRTIDNYLREDSSVPSADAAVRIARVLGVSVEYLITGNVEHQQNSMPLFQDLRVVLINLESLNKRDLKIVLNLIKSLKELEESDKKGMRDCKGVTS